MNEKPVVYTERMPTKVALIGHLFGSSCLAYSLPKLYTTVSLTTHKGTKDTWKINSNERLSYQSIDLYLKHLQAIKNQLGYEGGFFVQSNNSFPQGIGLSSSASSFSALTACALKAICSRKEGVQKLNQAEMSALSAIGKDSSRHSFYSPWSIVENTSIIGASFGGYDHLSHVALVVTEDKKRISTAQVLALLEKNERAQEYKANVRKRVVMTHDHILKKNWKGIFECVWDDFNELQLLFSTSRPSFSFQTVEAREVLKQVKKWWDIYGDGPIVSMGIGYVVHLLFRKDQIEMKENMLSSLSFIEAIEGTYPIKETEQA
ncbi:MAG: hypothetical protein VX737_03645 [Pseudomonadota bacterium]|nr:hypothetical protein [Pseudomonadota bacterium]